MGKSVLGGLVNNTIAGRYWNPLNLIRSAAAMLIMKFLRQNFYLQIFMLLAISTFFQVMIVGSKPILTKLYNNM